MPSPDPTADPETEPYRVLGVDPKGGSDTYRPLSEIESQAKELIRDNRDDETAYRNFQLALKQVRERHPARSSKGVWRVPLRIEPENPTVEVQTPFTLRVVDFLGEPVPDATLSRGDGMRIGRTDAQGTEEVEITTETGTVTVVASKQADGNREFVDAETDIEVERTETHLQFAETPSGVSAGDAGTVRVVDENGNPKAHVTVTPKSGESGETGADGYAEPVFTDAGEIELVADRPETTFETFVTAETTVGVARRRVSLRFAAVPDATTVGQTEQYRVTDSDDNGVQGVEVTLGNETAVTSATGTVRLQTPQMSPGEQTVTASKSDTGNVRFADARSRVEVSPRCVDLRFRDPPSKTDAVTSTTVCVVDDNGHPVPDAVVSAGTAETTTDDEGRATLSFERRDLGRVRLVAEKDGVTGTVFTPAEQQVSVTKQEISLTIRPETQSPTVDETVSFTVVDQRGDPVPEVTVRSTSQTTETDANGSAALSFDEGGNKRIIARRAETAKRRYDGDSVCLSVDRIQRQLVIRLPDDSILAYEPVTFTVTDTDGNEVENAVLTGDEIDRTETNVNGKATVQFDSPGDFDLKAAKTNTPTETYHADSVTVSVDEPPASVNLTDLPDHARPGEVVQLSVRDHRGDAVSDTIVRAVSRRANYTARTNHNGVAELTFEEPGMYQISATHRDYDVYDDTQFRVVE